MTEEVAAPARVGRLDRWALRSAVLAGLGLSFWLVSASTASADDTPVLPVSSGAAVVPPLVEAAVELPGTVVETVVAPLPSQVTDPLIERVVEPAVPTVVKP